MLTQSKSCAHRATTWVLLAALGIFASACSKATAEEIVASESTFAEQSAAGTLHFNVAPDGKAALVVKNDQGVIQKSNLSGQLTFVNAEGKNAVPLALDGEAGVLRADGPSLEGDVTEIRYALLLDGKPWKGSLHVPEQGTEGLVETAKSTESAPGAHGGEIHVIDGERYELVADADSGDMRVYVLGEKKPKALKLALDVSPPQQVELEWDDEGYYVTSLKGTKLPRKVSLVVIDAHEHAHVIVVGHRPGVVVIVDRTPHWWVHRKWHPGRGRGHYKGTPFGPPGHNKDRIVVVEDHDHGGKHKNKHKGK